MKKILYDLDNGDIVGSVYDGSIFKALPDGHIELEVIKTKPPIDIRTHFYSKRTTTIDIENKILHVQYIVCEKPKRHPPTVTTESLTTKRFKDVAEQCGITRTMILEASEQMPDNVKKLFLKAWNEESYVFPECNFVLEIKRILNISDELLEKIFILGNTRNKRIRK